MTLYELVGVSSLVTMMISFLMLVLGVRRKVMFLYLLNAELATLIYLLLMIVNLVTPSRIQCAMIGGLGVIYLLAMPFIS